MAKENETIADIIAEMRSDANADEYTPDGILGQKLNYIADRLEAARKRERGDCAKLREVLRECAQYIACVGEIGVEEVTINDKVHLIQEELTQKAIAALAAPPRNCDRFGGNNAKLQKVYDSECGKEYDPRDPISRQAYFVGYGNWLLALAKKGGAK